MLLASGILWMALFVWFREIDSTTLDAIAEWLSPEHVSGWIFYLAICDVCYVPLARRFLHGTRTTSSNSDTPD